VTIKKVLPYYPRTQHHPCPPSQATTIGGRHPLWIMGTQQRHLRLARRSADSVCLRARYSLHHAPPRTHTKPRTLTRPLHATTLHSHHTLAPHSHLCFGYKQPVPGALLGFVSAAAKDRVTPNIHSNYSMVTQKKGTRNICIPRQLPAKTLRYIDTLTLAIARQDPP